jgi:cytochrome c oxidase subunit II
MTVFRLPHRLSCCAALLAGQTACRDMQSTLSPKGPDAESISTLSWILFGGATCIFLLVIAFLAIALFGSRSWKTLLTSHAYVIGGGLIFPVVTLSLLLIYGLVLMRPGSADPTAGDPIRITVVGEQWWWRVLYQDGGAATESANELRIPTGRPIELTLTTADVIHSFWVPNLAGKVDMIPGRENKLTFTAGVPGLSRGQCAEYCGGAHALMAFYVLVLSPEEYEAWRRVESGPARVPEVGMEQEGQSLFLSSGCAACHTIRGTSAQGRIGPDLTHVGGRYSLAAGALPNDRAAFSRWITSNQHIKPENLMPPFGIFSDDELLAISTYLASLK